MCKTGGCISRNGNSVSKTQTPLNNTSQHQKQYPNPPNTQTLVDEPILFLLKRGVIILQDKYEKQLQLQGGG